MDTVGQFNDYYTVRSKYNRCDLVDLIIMGRKAETHTFIKVKDLLQMHENTLLNLFNSTIGKLDKKIDTLNEEN